MKLKLIWDQQKDGLPSEVELGPRNIQNLIKELEAKYAAKVVSFKIEN